jgi:hypothetical protein
VKELPEIVGPVGVQRPRPHRVPQSHRSDHHEHHLRPSDRDHGAEPASRRVVEGTVNLSTGALDVSAYLVDRAA